MVPGVEFDVVASCGRGGGKVSGTFGPDPEGYIAGTWEVDINRVAALLGFGYQSVGGAVADVGHIEPAFDGDPCGGFKCGAAWDLGVAVIVECGELVLFIDSAVAVVVFVVATDFVCGFGFAFAACPFA